MTTDPENTLLLELTHGPVTIALRPDLAPKHVTRVKELARQGFYDGLAFHRVIDGFMAQTGCPQGTGTGGSGQNLAAEFNDAPFERGTVGAARAQNPDSADSQWFICLANSDWLNGQYTVWGQVVDGMAAVDKIAKAPKSDPGGRVPSPDFIISLKVLADTK
jgi:peptidylprolyl isomerase